MLLQHASIYVAAYVCHDVAAEEGVKLLLPASPTSSFPFLPLSLSHIPSLFLLSLSYLSSPSFPLIYPVGVSGHGPSRGPAGQPAAKPAKQIPSSSSSYRPSSSSSSSSGPQQSSASPDNSGAGAGANWMSPSQHTRSVQPHPQSPVPAHVQTKHDQAAALMGLLAASGLTMDSLFAMGEEKQREALIAAATIHNSTRVPDSSVGASKSSSTTNTDKDDTSPSESDTPSESLPPPPKPAPVDPRKAMMEMIAKRAKAAAGDTGTADPAPETSRAETPPPPGGVKLREDPKYSKYFKMIKVSCECTRFKSS